MHAARQLLLDYFPHGDPNHLGGEERGERRVDTFIMHEAGNSRCYSVLSLRIDAAFVPDVVSEYPHIPYATELANAKPPRWREIGVHATTWTIRSPSATRGRFMQRGAVREAPVISARCVLYDWDTPWLSEESVPRPVALLVDGAWGPTVSGIVAATAADFRRGYVAHHEAGPNARYRHAWARDVFYDSRDTRAKIPLVEAILDGADLPDGVLDGLSAGPIEDMIGHELLDHVAASGERRTLWHQLLRFAYWIDEPADVRERLVALFGDPPR
ncbi:hypothetical protein [Methylobacterium sp. WL6]|uniref:hypothetical protein n=1 Tax=Methylobacterium sp. WL6 TaxID=2603901 RepID=UPI0011C773DA|nr:hypothetical protein [Methylobacterium sp. WL6]TXN70471.1 hypothetical protein FV230_10470 [Methylobacterium sp. WL6]